MDNKRTKVVIDCDTGIDDAVALLLCIQHLDVVGVTTVGGNTGLAHTSRNTRYVVQLTGRSIPVYAGYDRPMMTPLRTAPEVHGSDGLGSVKVPEPTVPLAAGHAVDYIIDTFMNNRDITLITLGPLTNIAHALLREPRLAERIPEIICMGGSMTHGNHSPASEFNIWVDPEAAKIVFESGIPIKMVGLNLTRQGIMTAEDETAMRAIGNPVSDFVTELLHFILNQGHYPICLCDACAVVWAIDPAIIAKSAPMHVVVETQGEFTRGMTLCDYRHHIVGTPGQDIDRTAQVTPRGEKPNVEVALELDVAAFKRLLVKTMEQYGR